MNITIGQVYEAIDENGESDLLLLVQCGANTVEEFLKYNGEHQIIALLIGDQEVVSCNRWVNPVMVKSAYDISKDELSKILDTGNWKFRGAIHNFLDRKEALV